MNENYTEEELEKFSNEADAIMETVSSANAELINKLLKEKGMMSGNELLALLTSYEILRIEIVKQFACDHVDFSDREKLLEDSRQAAKLMVSSGPALPN